MIEVIMVGDLFVDVFMGMCYGKVGIGVLIGNC